MTAEEKIEKLTADSISLLKKLVQVQSFSGEEREAANVVERFLHDQRIKPFRKANNVWALDQYYDEARPTLLLNSHLDTVRPNAGWTRDPFQPTIEDGKLFGLGSNDAGGSLVSLIATFLYYHDKKSMPYNIILAATAEEETSGDKGILHILDELGNIDLAIVGEPSNMALIIAERGHLVLEIREQGQSGHAARDTDPGNNAIYNAVEDIRWIQSYQFERESDLIGPVKMTATMIEGGVQPNVVPDGCRLVVDVRVPDVYTNQHVLDEIKQNVKGEVRMLTRDLKASRLPNEHPLIHTAKETGLELTASPTSSDQGLLDLPSVKIGPGQSERSHTADEFIRLVEIEDGIKLFIKLIGNLECIT